MPPEWQGSRRISLTDLRFFAPALTSKQEFHGNRLPAGCRDKLTKAPVKSVFFLPSDVGHRLFLSVPFREGVSGVVRNHTGQSRNTAASGNEWQNDGTEYQTCFVQAQIDLAFTSPRLGSFWFVLLVRVLLYADLNDFLGWRGRVSITVII